MKPYILKIELEREHIRALEQGAVLTISVKGVPSSANVDEDEADVQEAPPTESGGSFFGFFLQQIDRLQASGSARTSETYRAAFRKLLDFRKGQDLSPTEMDSPMMECFQGFLRSQNLSMNSVSFYIRILRAVYRRAVEAGMTVNRCPFRHVYTGIAQTNKRALTIEEIRTIKHAPLILPSERFARDMFLFSFYMRGMSFVDMAYLKKSDLQDGMLIYKRHKTGQRLSVRWEPAMQEIVDRYPSGNRTYILPIIKKPGINERNQYRGKQNRINKALKDIAHRINISQNLSMYCARHSWATIAREQKFPISIISHGMGHANERTTEIYLKSIDVAVIDNCNQKLISLID